MNAALDIPRSLSQILRSLGRNVDLDFRARRGSARRPVNVQVLFDGKTSGEAWALNLSSGGMRLVCEEELAVGDALCIRIEPGDDECSSGLIGHGRVVWVKGCPDGFVIGIEFIEPH
ncbi:MAG: PilZ domain-containing protein [Deltaproteobacteria bacterium]|nr:PilZ domain-containing protein [Deltaproteobacteria bacterium]